MQVFENIAKSGQARVSGDYIMLEFARSTTITGISKTSARTGAHAPGDPLAHCAFWRVPQEGFNEIFGVEIMQIRSLFS